MSWAVWLAGAAILFVPGAYLLRADKPKAVRAYFAACAVLAIFWVLGLGQLLGGETLAGLPKALLAMLAPGTLVLAIWSAQRDRARVMGRPKYRDAAATAAVLYGAAHTTEIGDTSNSGFGGES